MPSRLPRSAPARGDASVDLSHIDAELQALKHLTADLHVHDPPSGWSDAAADAEGGLAILTAVPTLALARANAAWARKIDHDGAAGKYLIGRIPAATSASQARARLVAGNARDTYELGFNGLVYLGDTADGSWKLYGYTRVPLGGATASVTLQLTEDALHVGTTTFAGKLDGSPEQSIAVASNAIAGLSIPDGARRLLVTIERTLSAAEKHERDIRIPARRLRAMAVHATNRVVFYGDSKNPSSAGTQEGSEVAVAVTRTAADSWSLARSDPDSAIFSIVDAWWEFY